MHIAIVGCGHGEIDKIYEVVSHIETQRSITVSLVIVCGDFQSVRNMTDLRCMACPVKYQAMHDFHRYYSGEKIAPILTIFVGGNHEASNYLQELPYGGWVAPNIYYMGNVGVVKFGGVRIAGVSGIYKGRDYLKGRWESPPYSEDTKRSVYHYRNLDLFRLKQMKSPIDIMMSHDWPKGIHNWGDVGYLLRRKPFFRDEIQRDELGSRPLAELLEHLKPSFWFSAHLHVKFSAVVYHNENQSSEPCSPESVLQPKPNPNPKITKFLALDKVLPRRQFLQIIEIPNPSAASETEGSSESQDQPTPSSIPAVTEFKLEFDPEWLAILRSTDHLQSVKMGTNYMPGPTSVSSVGGGGRYNFIPTDEEIDEISTLFEKVLKVPENFSQTVRAFEDGERPDTAFPTINPQTSNLCEKLCIRDPLRLLQTTSTSPQKSSSSNFNSNGRERFILGDPSCVEEKESQKVEESSYEFNPNSASVGLNFSTRASDNTNSAFSKVSHNPDEIELDLDEDSEEIGDPDLTFQSFSQSPKPSSSSLGIFGRKKLDLPPPKHDADADVGEAKATTVNSESEMEAFKSIFGEPNDSLFVIDTLGEPQPPESKRSKNQVLYE